MTSGNEHADERPRKRTSSVQMTNTTTANPSKDDSVIWTRPCASPGTSYGALLPLCLLSNYLSGRSAEDGAVFQALITSSLLFCWTLLEANKTLHWLFSYLQRRLVAFGMLLAYFSGDMDFSAALLVSVVAYLILMKEASSPPVAGNFSIGERSLTSQALALFLGVCMKNALIFTKSGGPKPGKGGNRELWEINCVIQVFGCAIFLALAITRFLGRGIGRKTTFVATVSCAVISAWYMLEKRILGQSLVHWFLRMLMGDSQKVQIVTLWSALLASSVGFAVGSGYLRNVHAQRWSTVDRKLFHVAITLVFVAGARLDPHLLHLAASLLFWGFLVAESCRVLDVWPISGILNAAFVPFLDEKDLSGPLTLTNIYLLVGCALPVWLSSVSSTYRPLTAVHPVTLLAGVLSVGVGDTAASLGGTLFGSHKWPGSHKSVEGSICCAVAQLTTVFLLALAGFQLSVFGVVLVSISIFVSTVLEAVTDQVDNLVLPLASYLILTHL